MYRQTNHSYSPFPANFPSGNSLNTHLHTESRFPPNHPFNHDPFFTEHSSHFEHMSSHARFLTDAAATLSHFSQQEPHVFQNNATVNFRNYQASLPLQHPMNPSNAARSTWTPPTGHTNVTEPAQARPTQHREAAWTPPPIENNDDSDKESSLAEEQTWTWLTLLAWFFRWFAEWFEGDSDCFDNDDAVSNTSSTSQPAVIHQTSLPQEPSAAAWQPLYTPTAGANHTPAPSSTLANGNETLTLSNCSLHVQEYVLNQTKKSKLSDRVKALDLTDAEEELFEKFKDPISFDYMDVPVSLHETFFDITTVLSLTKQENPCTRVSFKPLEIQSARGLVNECEEAITALLHQREQRPKC